jgi:membrane protein implicated in regulation of membrane protease activity
LPWLGAAVIFFANALLTLSQGYWWLAGFEAGTGLLAVLSAATVAKRSGEQRRSQTSTAAGSVPPVIR